MMGSTPEPPSIDSASFCPKRNEVDIGFSNGVSLNIGLSRDGQGRARLFLGFTNNGLLNIELVDQSAISVAVLFGRREG